MMCDNLSLYRTYVPPSATTQSTPTYFTDNDDEYDHEHRPYMSIKRKLSGKDRSSEIIQFT